ncbi:MAG: ornithine carbamoyltransferase [Nitrospinaceae bacterium]
MKRDFISLADHPTEELGGLIALAADMKRDPSAYRTALQGKTLGMIFNKQSTRTRISFEVGILQLGGFPLYFSPNELQLTRGETFADTARVLSRYLDAVMIRTFAHADLVEFTRHASIPVVNGLTDYNHPCQALGDMLTLKERLGTLAGRKLVYLGDPNNVAVSLLTACVKFGIHMTLVKPQGYQLDPSALEEVRSEADAKGVGIHLTHDVETGVAGADAVYTDTWTSMGQEAEHARRQEDLGGYQVNARVMSLARPGAVFMHCLPAHRGEEVAASVIDGEDSLVWDQAENRLHIQKAILHHLMR